MSTQQQRSLTVKIGETWVVLGRDFLPCGVYDVTAIFPSSDEREPWNLNVTLTANAMWPDSPTKALPVCFIEDPSFRLHRLRDVSRDGVRYLCWKIREIARRSILQIMDQNADDRDASATKVMEFLFGPERR